MTKYILFPVLISIGSLMVCVSLTPCTNYMNTEKALAETGRAPVPAPQATRLKEQEKHVHLPVSARDALHDKTGFIKPALTELEKKNLMKFLKSL